MNNKKEVLVHQYCSNCLNEMIADTPAIDVSEIAGLYEQRLILTDALAKSNPFTWDCWQELCKQIKEKRNG